MRKKISTSKGLRPNLLMGQHFLKSRAVIEKMISAANIARSDIVLEIGPGKGILTEALAEKAQKVIAVEKDARLADYLKTRFAQQKNIEIIHGDILKITRHPMSSISERNRASLTSLDIYKRYIVVANLPYYLTSRFLRKFLEEKPRPRSMTLMVQEEVAQRIIACPPHMNLLALSVQAYSKPKIIMRVSRKLFSPKPRVDSAIISLTDISDDFFARHAISPPDFFKIIKKAFSQKRKMLSSSLGIPSRRRPQELALADWIEIVRTL